MKSNREEILFEINSTIRSLRRDLGLLEDKLALLQDELAGGAEDAEAMTLDIDDEAETPDVGAPEVETGTPAAPEAEVSVQEVEAPAVEETVPEEAVVSEDTAQAVEDVVQLEDAETQVIEDENIESSENEKTELAENEGSAGESVDPFMDMWEDDSVAFCGMDDDEDLPEESVSEEGPVMEKVAGEQQAQPKEMTVNDVAEPTPAVIDEMMTRQAWRTDMAGSHVNDVRSAISLNDRILFINTLCHEDAVEFTSLVGEINAKSSFDEAVDYVFATHPQWNFESEVVYRFMMAVRRRFA